MDDTEFDTRLDRLTRAADVVNALPKQLQASAFQYLIGGVEVATAAAPFKSAPPAEQASTDSPAEDVTADSNGNGAARKSRRGAPKSNKAAPQDRDINLFPDDKTSFTDFAVEKSPRTMDEKYAVAVYWILRVAELPTATVAQVVSCFIAADWSLPSQVANAASQSRKAGYLSSAKAEDLQLTSIGINLVNKQLPRPVTK
ncbi:hypothetical protein [Microbacterium sp. NPDC077486]|uniref:hypothetical protein n=1 Tax=Microbacterium sp. NPDC077486 TaxID=3154766 RepID=UPI003422D4D6